ncbi:hypothetical protein KM043_007584 [Ampulex compressa]|nr:hypothetical protein KM043_007584 [Ampulex compressa]
MEIPLVRYILVLLVLRTTASTLYIDDPEEGISDVQLSRSRRMAKHEVTSCKRNQYFDEEEGRCLGIPGGGRAIRIDTAELCGINVLKAHCSDDNHYYICKKNKRILARCSEGQRFEDRLKRCVYGPNDRQAAAVTSAHRVDLDRIRPPACRRPGKFPVAGRCDLFYTCTTNGHRMSQSVYGCPESMGYDADKEVCDYVPGCENERVNASVCVAEVIEDEDRSEFRMNEMRSTVRSTERSDTTATSGFTTDVNFRVDEVENPWVEKERAANESEVLGADETNTAGDTNYYEDTVSKDLEPEKLDSMMVENDTLSRNESEGLDDYDTEYKSSIVSMDKTNCTKNFSELNNSCSDIYGALEDESRLLDDVEDPYTNLTQPIEDPLVSAKSICADNSSITDESCSDEAIESRSTKLEDIEDPYTNSTELIEETLNSNTSTKLSICETDNSSLSNDSCTDEILENRSTEFHDVKLIDPYIESTDENDNKTDTFEDPYPLYTDVSTQPTICVEDSLVTNNSCPNGSIENRPTQVDRIKPTSATENDNTADMIEEPLYSDTSTEPTICTEDSSSLNNSCFDNLAGDRTTRLDYDESIDPYSRHDDTNSTGATEAIEGPYALRSTISVYYGNTDDEKVDALVDTMEDGLECSQTFSCSSSTSPADLEDETTTGANVLSTIPLQLRSMMEGSGFRNDGNGLIDTDEALGDSISSTTEEIKRLHSTTEWPLTEDEITPDAGLLSTSKSSETRLYSVSRRSAYGTTDEPRFMDEYRDATTSASVQDTPQTLSTFVLQEEYLNEEEKTTKQLDVTETPSTPSLEGSYFNEEEKMMKELDLTETTSTPFSEELHSDRDERTTKELDVTQTPTMPLWKELYSNKEEKTTKKLDLTETTSTPLLEKSDKSIDEKTQVTFTPLLDESYTNVEEKRAVPPEENLYTTRSNTLNTDYDPITQPSKITSLSMIFSKINVLKTKNPYGDNWTKQNDSMTMI